MTEYNPVLWLSSLTWTVIWLFVIFLAFSLPTWILEKIWEGIKSTGRIAHGLLMASGSLRKVEAGDDC